MNSLATRLIRGITFRSGSLLFNSTTPSAAPSAAILANQTRDHYTFGINNRQVIRYRRSTRPKKTNDDSLWLTYEQSQFVELIGVTKSWNSWNTSNLLEGKRAGEHAADDLIIRKFLYGTYHDLFASEIIIKRKFNTINVGFLVRLPNKSYANKVYFLTGYAEELLSCLLKCVVRIQVQTIYNKRDLIFRYW